LKAFIILLGILTTGFVNGQDKTKVVKPFVFIVTRYDLDSNKTKKIIQPDYASKNQGFICRQEWLFEKKTGLPLRVRLGSLDYVNKLEGK
jgi:hypothetical protein